MRGPDFDGLVQMGLARRDRQPPAGVIHVDCTQPQLLESGRMVAFLEAFINMIFGSPLKMARRAWWIASFHNVAVNPAAVQDAPERS
jgi:hypothetical protein